MTSLSQYSQMAQNVIEENLLEQLAEKLCITEKKDTDDGNNMEQESPDSAVRPSEKAMEAEQGRQYPTRDRKAPSRLTINSCVCLHDNGEQLIQDPLKESDSAK